MFETLTNVERMGRLLRSMMTIEAGSKHVPYERGVSASARDAGLMSTSGTAKLQPHLADDCATSETALDRRSSCQGYTCRQQIGNLAQKNNQVVPCFGDHRRILPKDCCSSQYNATLFWPDLQPAEKFLPPQFVNPTCQRLGAYATPIIEVQLRDVLHK